MFDKVSSGRLILCIEVMSTFVLTSMSCAFKLMTRVSLHLGVLWDQLVERVDR